MSRRTALPFALDAALILLFAVSGRRSHDEGVTFVGVLAVAWPFLTGWLVGAAAMRLDRTPLDVRRAAIALAIALPVAFAFRAVSGRGLAPAFLVVAIIAHAVLLLGWRAAMQRVRSA